MIELNSDDLLQLIHNLDARIKKLEHDSNQDLCKLIMDFLEKQRHELFALRGVLIDPGGRIKRSEDLPLYHSIQGKLLQIEIFEQFIDSQQPSS